MKLAVMQPYIFPYLGYFQLLYAVDTFVFYDDVNYIKRGWVNRNRILVNGKDYLFTIPCLKASQNKLIYEIEVSKDQPEFIKLIKIIESSYKKAPYFEQTFSLIKNILNSSSNKISSLAIESIIQISAYLKLNVKFMTSSISFPETRGMEKADRLIELCNLTKSQHYINSIGGKELYDKVYFKNRGVELNFIESNLEEYKQFKNEFIPGLSIIDLLMFNSVETINFFLTKYRLI